MSAIVFASSTILFSFSALFATSSNPRSTSRLLNAALPECFPSTILALGSPSIPTLSGVMISYVSACLSTPCWWIPTLVGEGVGADDRLVRLHGDPRVRRDLRSARGTGGDEAGRRRIAPGRRIMRANCAANCANNCAPARRLHDHLGVDAAVDGEVLLPRAQRHHALLERRVPRALADAVERHLDLPRALLHRGERVGGGEAEVVVAVRRPHDLLAARLGVRDQVPARRVAGGSSRKIARRSR